VEEHPAFESKATTKCPKDILFFQQHFCVLFTQFTTASKDHDLMKLYEVPGIPFVILIGPSGRIDYLGHPGKVNLQERILKLSSLTIE